MINKTDGTAATAGPAGAVGTAGSARTAALTREEPRNAQLRAIPVSTPDAVRHAAGGRLKYPVLVLSLGIHIGIAVRFGAMIVADSAFLPDRFYASLSRVCCGCRDS